MLAKALARRPDRKQGSVVAIVLIAIGAVTLSVLLQGSPSAQTTASATASASASASSGVNAAAASAEPSAQQAEPWTPVELSPLAAVATFEPSARDDAGVPPDATFTLASLTGEPARAIAERLEISPATAFTVAESRDSATATIKPTTALTAGDTYRFELRAPDGTVAGSWAFRVRGPVGVTSTIPGDATTGVPVRTGVEVTFDQEGVADMADHFSIEPAVKGRFEHHGRTQVFVPSSLAPATTYTVTVRKGLARTGTDLTLPADVVFQFETEGPATEATRFEIGREVIEAGPAEPPIIGIRAIVPWLDTGRAPTPTTAKVRVYRFPSLAAARGTLATFLAAPHWTQYSDPVMPTAGLRLVTSFTARLQPLRYDVLLLRLPTALDEGWYVVEIQGARRAQAFLQVTPVSAWVSVLEDRTVVWTNDVTTHQPIEHAKVAVDGGRVFATSGTNGLAIGRTPRELVPATDGHDARATSPMIQVTSGRHVLLVPFDVRNDGVAYPGEWWNGYGNADESYWAMLYTDRGVYRRTDRIEAWGYLRGRDDGRVPAKVVVRLVLGGGPRDAAVAIESVEARPGVDGAFTASLPVSGLPFDQYEVQAVVDGRVVVSRWVEVSVIRKPPYQLALSPDHTAVIAGTTVTWTSTATFFDGTPAASLDLAMRDDQLDQDRRLTTDARGQATLSLKAPPSSDSSSWYNQWDVRVRPVGPEGAEILVYEAVRVFPSAYHLDATGVVDGDRLQVDGSLHEIDLAKAERQMAERDRWDADPSGAPVGGKTVTMTITELIPVRRQVGSAYDYVNKVVRPIYEYDYDRTRLQTLPVKSHANGSLTLSIAIPNADHQYEVLLSTRDDAGRLQERTIWASQLQSSVSTDGVEFVTEDGTYAGEADYGIGEHVTWRMVDNGRDLPSGGNDRYLYVVAQRGLRSAVITDQATFRRRFAAADAPGVFVMGVRFTGTNYAPKAAAWASFDATERAIDVQVRADRDRYRPGETATLSVRTTRPDGSPVAATVVVQAVDQKLYAMGDAEVPDPLTDLNERVASGIIRLTATHQVPTMSGPEGEGGDTTGGGPRSEFKDTLLFRELRTDASGRGTTTLRMSDDLTSWHITASAVTGDLRAGVGELMVPVGLPLFVELTVADTYAVSDRPAIQVRAFGEGLRAGDQVDFTVASRSLGLAEQKVHGTAFEPVSVELPELTLGTQSITASAVAPSRTDDAGKALTDGLTRTFEVVASRLTASKVAYRLVTEGLPAAPAGADRSLWTFTDAGRGQLVPVLSSLAERGGLRLDRSLAQSLAHEALVQTFGRDPASLPTIDFDSTRYPVVTRTDSDSQTIDAGISLLPYSDADPWLAARVALLAPDVFQAASLRDALITIRDLPATRRDLQIAAIAGLASLGEPVLDQLQEARRQPDLTPTELIYLALGFEAVGDDSSAFAIERDLLARHGERLGPWVRLRVDSTESSGDPTALLAVVAAGLSDPLAVGLADYGWSNPAPDTVNALELAAYATRSLSRVPAAAASFAYTVDGRRSVVDLGPGGAFGLSLTAEQARSLSVETISGRVAAIVEARIPVEPSSLRRHPDLTLTRTIPASPIPTDRLVEVNLTATFAPSAPNGCYDVVEFVPSGLAPLTGGLGETDERGITWPSSVVGQEVRFCASNSARTGHTARLRYLARVVNEGTFSWEPAIMQLPGAPELLAMTPSGTAAIGTRR